MDERLKLAEGRPQPRRLMAAMAQLDCGQCGYVCQTYAEALAKGEEASLGLCVPGGKATQKMLKALLAVLPQGQPVYAVGGVDAGNFAEWRRAGASGFGIGSALYRPGDVAATVGMRAREMVAAWHAGDGA